MQASVEVGTQMVIQTSGQISMQPKNGMHFGASPSIIARDASRIISRNTSVHASRDALADGSIHHTSSRGQYVRK